MITLERITKFNIQEKLAEAIPFDQMTRGFFGHYMTLGTFANLNGPELYLASNEKEKYIVLWKRMKREYRFLFRSPSQEFFDEFMDQYDPLFVAANLLPSPGTKENIRVKKRLFLIQRKF
jgi:hypothetical protein